MKVIQLLSVVFALNSGCLAEESCVPRSNQEVTTESHNTNTVKPKCSLSSSDQVLGRMVNGTCPRGGNLLPSWANFTLVKQGQEFAKHNILSISTSHIFGLIMILAFPDSYKVLLYTNESDTAVKAAKRYASTIKKVATWYNTDLDSDDEDNPAIAALMYVRGKHSQARDSGNKRMFLEKQPLIQPSIYEHTVINKKMWAAFDKDMNRSSIPEKRRKLPISHVNADGSYYAASQFQMAMTQFAFVGLPLLFPEQLGIKNVADEDLIAFNHLWAVLGYALGIEDEYNVALQPDLKSTKQFYKLIFEEWFTPNLFNCPFHCKVLIEAMLRGFGIIVPILSPQIMLVNLIEKMFQIKAKELKGTLIMPNFEIFLNVGIAGFLGIAKAVVNTVEVLKNLSTQAMTFLKFIGK